MKHIWLACLLLLMTILTACATEIQSDPDNNGGATRKCDTGGVIVGWVDFLKINDFTYERFSRIGNEGPALKGNKIGEVTFMLADCAPPDHISQNGDAAFLEAGTPIYEVKGYPAELMVEAAGKLYIVDRNEEAKSVVDLYPIKGKVKDLHLQSSEDGSRVHTFTKKNKKAFLDDFFKQELIDQSALRRNGGTDGPMDFIEIELENGAYIRLVYWKDSNAFSVARSNDRIAAIIEEEKSRAAGKE
ncbi:hypothetical protein V1502_02420 [Bacillus sp. SCS-153A]|uniref:hypothetical protein n=1 Tax=Rossellomorea sedimentorum TaxID=3115294 RepID=UPI003906C072